MFNKDKDKKAAPKQDPQSKTEEQVETAAAQEETPASTTDLAVTNPLEKLIPLSSIPEQYRPAMQALMAEMNPVKRGFSEEATRDWMPTEIRVRQGLSRGVPDTVPLGQLYNSVGELVKSPVKLTLLYMYKSNIQFEPGGGSKVVCSSIDTVTSMFGTKCDECPEKPFRNGQPTLCSTVINAIVVLDGLKLALIRFQKTSYKAGGVLMKQAQKTPLPWSKWYELKAKKETNKNGTEYYVLTVDPTGEDVDPKLQVVCDGLNQIIEAQHKLAKERTLGRVVNARLEAASLEGESPITDSEVEEPNFADRM